MGFWDEKTEARLLSQAGLHGSIVVDQLGFTCAYMVPIFAPLMNVDALPCPFSVPERYTPHLNRLYEPALESQVGQW